MNYSIKDIQNLLSLVDGWRGQCPACHTHITLNLFSRNCTNSQGRLAVRCSTCPLTVVLVVPLSAPQLLGTRPLFAGETWRFETHLGVPVLPQSSQVTNLRALLPLTFS